MDSASLNDFNVDAWTHGDFVRDYGRTTLDVDEVVLLARHSDALHGPTLELGCGAGRVTRVLAGLTHDLCAIDVSERMVGATAAAVPSARVQVGDLRELAAFGPVGAVVAFANVIDVLEDDARRRALAGMRAILEPGGRLLFSGHNLAHVPLMNGTSFAASRAHVGTLRAVAALRKLPARRANRRRALAFEHAEDGYAIVNDVAHDYRMAHYYIDRDGTAAQLAEAGFTLIECIDRGGELVPEGAGAAGSAYLHYAAAAV